MQFTIYGIMAKQGIAVTWKDGVVDHPGVHRALQDELEHQHRVLDEFGDEGNMTACLPCDEHDSLFAFKFISFMFTRIYLVEGCTGLVTHLV